MSWDPDHYLHFGGHRVRPALDLMGRVPLATPERIADLGCGPGNVTRLLNDYWPRARITGVDNSPEMLSKAFAEGLDVTWLEADIREWAPEEPFDLIFSNAALQWCDGHEELFPALFSFVAPQGVLAVQMPRNHQAPSHVCMTEAVRAGSWASTLEPHLREQPVAEPRFYHHLLAPLAWRVDIWESEYLQVLQGENPVVEWTRGTALKPLLDALVDEGERADFEAAYAERIAHAYPPDEDGKTYFPFRRLFIIAQA